MPVLEDPRSTKEITLPNSGAKLEVYDGLLAGDFDDILATSPESGQVKMSAVLERAIKSWDFTDKNEKTLPITQDNIRMMQIGDMNYILEQAQLDDFFQQQVGSQANQSETE